MKSILINLLAAALVVVSINAEEKKPMSSANEVAVIKTSEGEMVAEFWPDVAPNTVENFKKLARSGFYDGTAFHRIDKGSGEGESLRHRGSRLQNQSGI